MACECRPTLHVSGCVGGINGLANILGDEVCNIYKLFTESKLQEAVELHLRLVAPNSMVRNKPQRTSSSIFSFRFARLDLEKQLRFRGWTASIVERYPTFRQTLKLPSSGWVFDGCFCQPYIERSVGGELSLMVLIDEAEVVSNPAHHLLTAVYKTALKNVQPLHTHPEDGTCSICQHAG